MLIKRLPLFFTVLAAPAIFFADGTEPTPAIKKGLDSIHAEFAMKHVNILASKEFEGRETGEAGCEKAAQYLATQFKSLGLLPLGDAADGNPTYFQNYPITIAGMDEGSGLIVTDGDKQRVVSFGNDMRSLISLVPKDVPDELEIFDAGEIALEDPAPPSSSPSSEGRQRKVYKLRLPEAAAGKLALIRLKDTKATAFELNSAIATALDITKAAGAILAPAEGSTTFDNRFERATNFATRRTKRYGAPSEKESQLNRSNNPPVLVLANAEIANGLKGKKAKFILKMSARQYLSKNIVGLIKGSDPALNDTYIVHSAHYDHEGIRGGKIYFGADDNASGTSCVLALANAYKATEPPRRSVIFLLVSGEEKGLWGSEYFADHCPVQREKLVADINTDMVGRTLLNGEQKPAYMMMTPSPRNRDFNTLAARSMELSAQYGFPNMENGDIYWQRSDHYNFAKHGIPTMFLCNGEHEDYHQPTDTPDKIDGDKIARSAKLAFHLGYETAMSDTVHKVTGRVRKPKTESAPAKEDEGKK